MSVDEKDDEIENLGVKAIIELQAMMGIVEPEDEARKNWRAMSESARQNTMMAHAVLCPPKQTNDG